MRRSALWDRKKAACFASRHSDGSFCRSHVGRRKILYSLQLPFREMHLFPRKTGDLGEYGNKGKGPAWWYPMEKMYADSERPGEEELTKMKQQLLKELDTLL